MPFKHFVQLEIYLLVFCSLNISNKNYGIYTIHGHNEVCTNVLHQLARYFDHQLQLLRVKDTAYLYRKNKQSYMQVVAKRHWYFLQESNNTIIAVVLTVVQGYSFKSSDTFAWRSKVLN